MDRQRRMPSLSAIWVIAVILIVVLLHWIRVLAVPVAFSLFLLALVWPVYEHRFFQRRVLRPLALIASVLLVLIAAAAVLMLVSYSIRILLEDLPPYGERMQETYRSIGFWLEQRGLAYWPAMAEQFSPGAIFHLVHEAAARISAVMGFLALTLIFLVMGLWEAGSFRRRLPRALGANAATEALVAFKELGWKFRRYMLIRSAVSVITGLLTWLFALLVGLDFAVTWGTLAFALNYIPFVGSILAVFPPVLFSVVQFESWQTPTLVFVGMVLIQFSIGNFLDPRLEGRALALSPFAVIFSIFFWGIVWGVPGAFLGVPLTIALATICTHVDEARWIARLLTPESKRERLEAGSVDPPTHSE